MAIVTSSEFAKDIVLETAHTSRQVEVLNILDGLSETQFKEITENIVKFYLEFDPQGVGLHLCQTLALDQYFPLIKSEKGLNDPKNRLSRLLVAYHDSNKIPAFDSNFLLNHAESSAETTRTLFATETYRQLCPELPLVGEYAETIIRTHSAIPYLRKRANSRGKILPTPESLPEEDQPIARRLIAIDCLSNYGLLPNLNVPELVILDPERKVITSKEERKMNEKIRQYAGFIKLISAYSGSITDAIEAIMVSAWETINEGIYDDNEDMKKAAIASISGMQWLLDYFKSNDQENIDLNVEGYLPIETQENASFIRQIAKQDRDKKLHQTIVKALQAWEKHLADERGKRRSASVR